MTRPLTEQVPRNALTGSRLIRLLGELAVTDIEPSAHNFGGRFGQLFALSDSISLSEMHGGLANTHFESYAVDTESVTAEFLAVQQRTVESIGRRFVGDSSERSPRNRFPALRPGATAEQLTTYSGYQGFYVTLQREMEREVQHMQSLARDAASGLSPQLAQLVVIDSTLGDTLAAHSRKLLAQIPRLLQLRFEYLRQQHHQALFNDRQDEPGEWLRPGGWLDQFRVDMHRTALAELELRLQPALGLLEAVHAQEQTAQQQNPQRRHSL